MFLERIRYRQFYKRFRKKKQKKQINILHQCTSFHLAACKGCAHFSAVTYNYKVTVERAKEDETFDANIFFNECDIRC